ncbi:hypothetical protein [Haloparvum sedimenti]|uniref:hypothetical protein n=1 Tax=Haloparvum sedimenti TaxID=1678448 RepID=UPI00071E96BA|nr:hypothetical protein [Haloparvum sedimenti]
MALPNLPGTKTVASLFLLVAVALGIAAGAGGVAGLEADANGEFLNETVSVDNSTDSVYVELTNVSNGPLNVTVSGLYNGTETVVNETQIDSPTNTTVHEWQANSSEYDGYRIVVSEDSTATNQSVESISAGTFDETSGGGGGAGDGSGFNKMHALVVVIVAAAAGVMLGDD